MLPRNKNGVIDTHLKVRLDYGTCLNRRLLTTMVIQVYGTKNIRVVDLSIVPLHFAAHTQGKQPRLVSIKDPD